MDGLAVAVDHASDKLADFKGYPKLNGKLRPEKLL